MEIKKKQYDSNMFLYLEECLGLTEQSTSDLNNLYLYYILYTAL